ncbi:ATP-dependent DNA helicase homolog RECG, chloroplastic isoform X2 [Punica granatum]|nr:ATP-dependent DNA helicase homolog RECG, chloroplastic isoform X2 [Punica granatum]XP_031401074.1 ATP-dependent DNA helicase homolog RECG, chloroplastic isoform X2 [Punica granatum]
MSLNSGLSGEILSDHFAFRRLFSCLYIPGRTLSSRVTVRCAAGAADFFDKEWTEPQSDASLKVEFDASAACKKFPSIIIGSSRRVELYDGGSGSVQGREEVLSDSMGESWALPARFCEQWSSLPLHLQEVNSSSEVLEIDGKVDTLLSDNSVKTEIERLADDPAEVEEQLTKATASPSSTSDVTTVEVLLDQPIGSLRGLSKRQSSQLEKLGFHTLRKLLHHFPRTYADLQNAQNGINDGEYLISVGKIISSKGIRAGYSFGFLEVIVGCEIGDTSSSSNNFGAYDDRKEKKMIYLHLKKFFRGTRFTSQPFLRSLQEKHKIGDTVCVSGKVKTMSAGDHYEMREYHIDVLEDDQVSSVCTEERPYPIYPSKGGLPPTTISAAITSALQALTVNVDPIPQDILQEFGLLGLYDAYMGIHKPRNIYDADSARKRFIFDEFFYLQLARLFQMLEGLGTEIEKNGLLDKYRKPELSSTYVEDWSSLTQKFLKTLPYTLTSGQLNAVSEIIWDLKRPVPMNRLLQGDVGCGKTVVAFLACMEVIGSGYQAAFMVPTELLAVQHYEHLLELLEKIDLECKPSIALLTGSTSAKQSRIIRQGLVSGQISMIIGTHSLIAESVEFSSLRIAVVDEQHRFGVIQRGRFNSKLCYAPTSLRTVESPNDNKPKVDASMAPHVLAMSATPIPRSLALALYGDVSLTQITDLPPGRIPVETHIIEGNEHGFEEMYDMIFDELESGGKVYLVYPIIEQSEQLPQLRAAASDLESISKRFLNYNCGLLHGKMKSDEKEEALRRFRSGETQILLATQVIEIGVDIPDASMMVVMNAERFGIAQLHQLRGRVGRGSRKSKCVLLASGPSSCMRLKVLENSSDGFHLANMDLLLRGPGDLLGKKQSGHLPEFPVARLEIDGNILQEAHLAVLKILGSSHNLDWYPKLKAELSMRQPLSSLGD